VVINQLTIHFVMDILDKQDAGDIPAAHTPELAKLQETLKEFEELINLSHFFRNQNLDRSWNDLDMKRNFF